MAGKLLIGDALLLISTLRRLRNPVGRTRLSDDGFQMEFLESRFSQPTRRNTEFRPISNVRLDEVGHRPFY